MVVEPGKRCGRPEGGSELLAALSVPLPVPTFSPLGSSFSTGYKLPYAGEAQTLPATLEVVPSSQIRTELGSINAELCWVFCNLKLSNRLSQTEGR